MSVPVRQLLICQVYWITLFSAEFRLPASLQEKKSSTEPVSTDLWLASDVDLLLAAYHFPMAHHILFLSLFHDPKDCSWMGVKNLALFGASSTSFIWLFRILNKQELQCLHFKNSQNKIFYIGHMWPGGFKISLTWTFAASPRKCTIECRCLDTLTSHYTNIYKISISSRAFMHLCVHLYQTIYQGEWASAALDMILLHRHKSSRHFPAKIITCITNCTPYFYD